MSENYLIRGSPKESTAERVHQDTLSVPFATNVGYVFASLLGWIDTHKTRLRQELENDTPQGSRKKIKYKETDK